MLKGGRGGERETERQRQKERGRGRREKGARRKRERGREKEMLKYRIHKYTTLVAKHVTCAKTTFKTTS